MYCASLQAQHAEALELEKGRAAVQLAEVQQRLAAVQVNVTLDP